jgi:hypothetical protein
MAAARLARPARGSPQPRAGIRDRHRCGVVDPGARHAQRPPVVTHRHEVSIGGVRVYGHGAASPFEDHVEAFRADYAARFAGTGRSYEEFETAYRHGHALAADERFSGRSWDDIAADARADWERRHPGNAWETFKDAVRHAWERVTR